jgi:hypothetical protein
MQRHVSPLAAHHAASVSFCPVTCHRCRMSWVVDPALSEPCRRCSATAGEPCWDGRRLRPIPHLARDYAALRTGRMPPCEGLTWDGRHVRTAAIDLT